MSSPIFDSTFGTGRFKSEEPTQSYAETFGTVTFWYRNYRGEISRRVAAILGLRWGSSEYHKEPQWLLLGFDLEKEAEREFAVRDMAPTRDALAQSDAEPVAQNVLDALEDYLTHAGFNLVDGDVERIARVVLAQSAAPPRPDASGLIEALERISKSDVYDMDTLHPDRCASVAAEALKAFRATDRSA